MNREHLDKYCTLLTKQVFEEYSVYKILENFKSSFTKLKSEILSNCLKYDTDKKIEYLNLVSSTVSSFMDNKYSDFSVLNKWLDLFEISFSTLINSNIDKEDIHFYLDADYAEYEDEEYNVIIRKDIFKFQDAFFNAFKHHFANEVIIFCNNNKANFSKKTSEVITIHKSFKDEYLKVFCKNISNERVLKETCFKQVYNSMVHYVPYFENEILENLLILSSDKKDDYINYVIDTIQKTEFSDCDQEVIAEWLKKYNSSIDEFPDFANDELNQWLLRYYNGYFDKPTDFDFILDIQSDFYYYAAGLEAQKMISFLESKKRVAVNNIVNQSETNEKIKWIGKPSQLGFIIGKLADLGYINAPTKPNGEINFTQFAKQVNNTFEVDTTESTLSKYLNLESEKGSETVRKFNDNGFDIPHIKTVS
ncbi:MAG: hypothetical protein H7Z76_10690 [Methylotenera sp.]|nr:hypothetical protein [Flavobacterium sp.]